MSTPIELSTATDAEKLAIRTALGTAPISIQVDQRDDQRNTLVHDNCQVDALTLTQQTLGAADPVLRPTCNPGPGYIQSNYAPAGSFIRYENGELLISGGAVQQPQVQYGGSAGIAATAGLTMIVRVVPGVVPGSLYGFQISLSDTTSVRARTGAVGVLSGNATTQMATLGWSQATGGTNDALTGHQAGLFEPGEEIALAVHYKTLTHQQYFIQGGRTADLGCVVGSDNWFLLGETKPTKQVETLTLANGATSNGNLTVTVTAANLVGSPKAYTVPLNTTDHNTALKVVQAIVAVLQADPALTANWDISTLSTSQTTGGVRAYAKVAAADDTTFSIVTTAGLGIPGITSTNTQIGYTADMTGKTIYPCIMAQYNGINRVRDVQVLSEWSPSHKVIVYGTTRYLLGTHIPSLAHDPVTGRLVATWQSSTSDASGDNTSWGAVRKPDGTWTDPQMLLAPLVNPEWEHTQNLSVVNGQLYLITNKTVNGAGPGWQLLMRTLSVNPSTYELTIGSAVPMGLTGSCLNYTPIITLPSGRIMMGYHVTDEATLKAYVAYSDNNGASWTQQLVAAPPSGIAWFVEPLLVNESAGAVGCYIRSAGGSAETRVAYYSRSTDGGATWSAAVRVPSIPQSVGSGYSGARMMAFQGRDGANWIVGCDNYLVRKKVTAWKVGDNAAILDKVVICDLNNETLTAGYGGDAIHNYPAAMLDGDDLVVMFAYRPGGLAQMVLAAVPWEQPVKHLAGGLGLRKPLDAYRQRPLAEVTTLASAATVTHNMVYGNRATLTLAHNVTLAPPTNPMPWDELVIHVRQAASGGPYTLTLDAAWEARGITTTMSTTAGETNTLRAYYSPLSMKWVLSSFQ